MSALIPKLLLPAVLLFAASSAGAQSLPVQVTASGNTATAKIGLATAPLADVTLTFDNASGLSAASLGMSAELVSLNDAALLARLPSQTLTQLDSALPLLITIEPPSSGTLSFNRTVRVEVHTHALAYTVGSSYRLLKAPLGGAFRDITDEVAPGSVRARGTTGGFSQFLVLTDVRESSAVVTGKLAWLRGRIASLPAADAAVFAGHLDAAESAVAGGNYATAIAALDMIRAEAAARAGGSLTQQWRSARDVENQAGELIAGAATAAFSVAYLRDFGQ
ncbi:MAG: hypothetical protein M3Q40_07475 [Pseudomonadota bacterium]|nr:hypothetical protein [Pseudomonadota bacterium]